MVVGCGRGGSSRSQMDSGQARPTSFAVAELTPEVEAQLRALVRRAVG